MKAFVKTNNGTFPNLNFYLAWESFNHMGYSVQLFNESDIPSLDINVETPVFAGVTIFKRILDKLGVNYPPFDCYPEVLNPYYGRNLRRSTIGVEKTKFHKDNVTVFVKPVLPKQFIGNVWESIINLIPLAAVPDDAEVWVCEPMDILSEYRCYVLDGEILGVKHYYGDWSITPPNKEYVERVIKDYKGAPAAYGIDFAVVKRPKSWENGMVNDNGFHEHPVVLEVNDGCNLGNYGLDAIHYGEMIVSRWIEIVSQGGSSEKLKTRMMNPMVGDITEKLSSVDYEKVAEMMRKIKRV